MNKILRSCFSLAIAASLFFPATADAYVVTNLKVEYQGGQMFITWTCPNVKNLRYNVYRSSTKIKDSTKLTAANYVGFVMDSSSKNIRLSEIWLQNIFLRTKATNSPLTASDGLYVLTCTSNSTWFYAVTVTDLSNGKEDKTITLGQNSRKGKLYETIAPPQPVWQDSMQFTVSRDWAQYYALFGNNQESAYMPAFNGVGSYPYLFYLSKRGTATKFPLYELFEGMKGNSLQGNGLGEFADNSINNCYILSMDDWLPVINGSSIGESDVTYWSGHSRNFNFYSATNSVPSGDTIKTYVLKRGYYTLDWVKNHFPIDTQKVYLVGISAGGFGALMTSLAYPGEYAAVYEMAGPSVIAPTGNSSSAILAVDMWGYKSSNLLCDKINPATGQLFKMYDVLDERKMLNTYETKNLPPYYVVYGRQDLSVMWSTPIIDLFDSLEANHCGGTFFWDQRNHNGYGGNFLDTETTPNFSRFALNKFYPAFSNCSIDFALGNGSSNSGAAYGALNGYLDWKDDMTESNCGATVNVFIKSLYIGGVLYSQQYTTCTADVTFRRLQSFKPANGTVVNWTNYNSASSPIQTGSFTYNGGLITLKGITINSSGNSIQLSVSNCHRDEVAKTTLAANLSFTYSATGVMAHAGCTEDEDATLTIFDLAGRSDCCREVQLHAGANDFILPLLTPGMYVVQLQSKDGVASGKVFMQ